MNTNDGHLAGGSNERDERSLTLGIVAPYPVINAMGGGMELKRGTRFIHARWLDENKGPLVCVVTRVALGAVYWKVEGERKARHYFPLEKATDYVKEVL